jgi:hypothetical protein
MARATSWSLENTSHNDLCLLVCVKVIDSVGWCWWIYIGSVNEWVL